MDDLDVLARDFGFGARGKSNPMRSDAGDRRSASVRSSSPLFDEQSNRDGNLFNDVFGGPPKYSSTSTSVNNKSSAVNDFDYDSIFKSSSAAKDSKSSKENAVRTSSLPVYDKPVYDDDIFDGLPGLKSKSPSSTEMFEENVFATRQSPPERLNNSTSDQFVDILGNLGKNNRNDTKNSKSEAFDDLLGNLRTNESMVDGRSGSRSSSTRGLDDLLGGFGGGSTAAGNRSASDSNHGQKPAGSTSQPASTMMDDPFVVLESTPPPVSSSEALFQDPLEEIGNFGKFGNTRTDSPTVSGGVFDDLDPLNNFRKSSVTSPDLSNRGSDTSPSRSGPSRSGTQTAADSEHLGKPSIRYSDSHSQPTVPDDNFQESPIFDIPPTNSQRSFHQNTSSPPHASVNNNESNFHAGMSPRSEEHLQTSDDVWLTVSEIPLFTQPTRAPPPSRPPPPIPRLNSKSESSFFPSESRKRGDHFASPPAYTSYSQIPQHGRPAPNSTSISQIDELEDFVTGTTKNFAEEAYSPSGEELNASSVAAAAAMKEAMVRAEAKFRHAKEVREREYAKAAKTKESVHEDQNEDILQDAQEREDQENQERLEREKRLREEEEKERRRIEREKERAREIERERARQAVERATREARERAAVEARLKAERVAVGKVQNEARERAERAAVFRAQAEARERAAVEARERQEKAAAEARERVAAEARERQAREKAAAEKAAAEARRRAERAAVDRAAAEARERAAVDARERAAAAARASQQKSENDVDLFFNSRANSVPRSRGSSDSIFDPPPSRGPGGHQGSKTTHPGSSSNMQKAFSTTNIVDDLSSIFGVDAQSGDFQEVEGETEERRKARLDRHQRTQERAARALAEKNQRDLQVQREQEERSRISETLDIEIKRWAAGKEGNLRALLSTLQYVLWPECGWQPVSLTDLIVGSNVKKVYRKATLCIHPDKVQQKGATLQQKYIAEKVFDLLKVYMYVIAHTIYAYVNNRKPGTNSIQRNSSK